MTKSNEIKGRVHSFQSLGTLDGPGVRFVVFMQGCPLRCQYCHNPDTWDMADGKEYSVEEVASRVVRYKNYFGEKGGVTVSGGEPLMQLDFVIELFKALKAKGVNTCADTTGISFNPDDKENVKKHEELLQVCDLFLLDIKHIDNEKHKTLTGLPNNRPLAFAKFLSDHGKRIWIRHVLVPGITDDDESLASLRSFMDTLSSVEKVEVLPYHTMGEVKYEKMGIPYVLKGVQPPCKERVANAKIILTK